MARLSRWVLAGYPHHVMQWGHNRQAVVLDDEDRHVLLSLWQEYAQSNRVSVHAYVLMDNHFHLLLTPATSEGLPAMMQAVGRRYVRYFNHRYQRSGTLFEGRYRCAVLEPDAYTLACMAYIELNPVRAGIVTQAQDYPWSSHAHFIGVRAQKLISAPPQYWQLGNTPFAREMAYARWVEQGLTSEQTQALSHSVRGGWPLGTAAFIQQHQQTTARRLSPARAGRPRNPKRETSL